MTSLTAQEWDELNHFVSHNPNYKLVEVLDEEGRGWTVEMLKDGYFVGVIHPMSLLTMIREEGIKA